MDSCIKHYMTMKCQTLILFFGFPSDISHRIHDPNNLNESLGTYKKNKTATLDFFLTRQNQRKKQVKKKEFVPKERKLLVKEDWPTKFILSGRQYCSRQFIITGRHIWQIPRSFKF